VKRHIVGSVAKAAVESPCINICKMEAGLCIGCRRTLDEIARWANVDDDGKRLILAAVAQRRSSAGRNPTDAVA
jgi:predicted Fe-S protein YdhL (DUF1289 family)